MTVKIQRLFNSRIDRNIVDGVMFESLRITIHNARHGMGKDDFEKYAQIVTQLFNPTVPETDILAEIIHAGIETMYTMARMDAEKEASE